MNYSFKEFCELDEETQNQLATLNEDLSGNQKKTKMKELEKLLSLHDWWWFMSDDSRSYKKGNDEQTKIHNLVSLLGKDGSSLYKQVAKKKGVMEMKKY
jgi:hypothetical protein